MGFAWNLTMEDFNEGYEHIERLRRAGKLEREVSIARASCILEPTVWPSATEREVLDRTIASSFKVYVKKVGKVLHGIFCYR